MDLTKSLKKMTALDYLSTAILIISIIMVVIYFIYFNGEPSTDSRDWGNFGDYFASVTGLVAFLGVLYTARLSEKRAIKAEEETEKREERDVFFKLLNLHQDRLESVIYIDSKISSNQIHNGLLAIEKYVNIANNILVDYAIDLCITRMSPGDLELIYKKQDRNHYEEHIYDRVIKRNGKNNTENYYTTVINITKQFFDNANLYSYEEDRTDTKRYYYYPGIYDSFRIEKTLDLAYSSMKLVGNVVNIKYGQILGQYYRNMYYVLETCNQFKHDKEYYFKLYRAQLSRNEIILCLLNAVSDKSSIKFVNLLKKYDILDDLYYKDFFLTKFDIEKWNGKELEFIREIFKCYLQEHPE